MIMPYLFHRYGVRLQKLYIEKRLSAPNTLLYSYVWTKFQQSLRKKFYRGEGMNVETLSFYMQFQDLPAKVVEKWTRWACQMGQKDCLKLLLENIQLVKSQASYLQDLLPLACWQGQLEIVKYLLSLPWMDHSKQKALMNSVQNRHWDIVYELLRDPLLDPSWNNNTLLKRECNRVDFNRSWIEYLLGDVRVINNFHLEDIVSGGIIHEEIVEILLDISELQDNPINWSVVFHNACCYKHPRVLQRILQSDFLTIAQPKTIFSALCDYQCLDFFEEVLPRLAISLVDIQHKMVMSYSCGEYKLALALFNYLKKVKTRSPQKV
jgi:hypothetical protein